jgi:hypothetical protein
MDDFMNFCGALALIATGATIISAGIYCGLSRCAEAISDAIASNPPKPATSNPWNDGGLAAYNLRGKY